MDEVSFDLSLKLSPSAHYFHIDPIFPCIYLASLEFQSVFVVVTLLSLELLGRMVSGIVLFSSQLCIGFITCFNDVCRVVRRSRSGSTGPSCCAEWLFSRHLAAVAVVAK